MRCETQAFSPEKHLESSRNPPGAEEADDLTKLWVCVWPRNDGGADRVAAARTRPRSAFWHWRDVSASEKTRRAETRPHGKVIIRPKTHFPTVPSGSTLLLRIACLCMSQPGCFLCVSLSTQRVDMYTCISGHKNMEGGRQEGRQWVRHTHVQRINAAVLAKAVFLLLNVEVNRVTCESDEQQDEEGESSRRARLDVMRMGGLDSEPPVGEGHTGLHQQTEQSTRGRIERAYMAVGCLCFSGTSTL